MKLYTSLLLILSGFTNYLYAGDVTIYRWVDKNNVVHFSQNQPKNQNFTELTMSQSTVKTNKATPDKNNKTTQKNSVNTENAIDKERCLTAKNNLSTLENFDSIQYKTSSGETRVLNDKQRKAQLAINKTQVELYCGDL